MTNNVEFSYMLVFLNALCLVFLLVSCHNTNNDEQQTEVSQRLFVKRLLFTFVTRVNCCVHLCEPQL
ncbi:hypothetical protein DICVIV_07210 [Dictyocaulus viviparus]|uniref:Uncharacterized protein n=1 Tax=Dictyocaulus viviparus TaxID=29172 RepID=A0A0D8XWK6_DICVI|nr:hypothetical protein DICVIV_07210 [Dictyocaulus viviparus]